MLLRLPILAASGWSNLVSLMHHAAEGLIGSALFRLAQLGDDGVVLERGDIAFDFAVGS
jgi:hypothetical protein